MKLTKIEICDEETGDAIAYLPTNGSAWLDPHGGQFTEEEEDELQDAAEDLTKEVSVAGKVYDVYVRAVFA